MSYQQAISARYSLIAARFSKAATHFRPKASYIPHQHLPVAPPTCTSRSGTASFETTSPGRPVWQPRFEMHIQTLPSN